MMTPEMADMPMNFSRSLHEKIDCFRHSHVSNAECCRQAQHSVAWQQSEEKLMTSYRAAWPSSSLAREPAKTAAALTAGMQPQPNTPPDGSGT